MPLDSGHKETDAAQAALEKKLAREYKRAADELEEKTKTFYEGFEKRNAKKLDALNAGRITQAQYDKWRKGQLATGKRWEEMRDTISKDLYNVNQIAANMINNTALDVYALNMNYGTYSMERDLNINSSFTLYDHATVERLIKDNPDLIHIIDTPRDKNIRWNNQKVRSELTQAILQGESVDKLAARMRNVAEMNYKASIRNARTTMTGAQSAGRLDSMKRAQSMGIEVKKQWVASLDNVTRDSHVDLDGEIQPLEHEFSNGLDYPGAAGPPEEVYNCRCRVVSIYPKYQTGAANDLSIRNTYKLNGMSYDEWKNKHKAKKAGDAARLNPLIGVTGNRYTNAAKLALQMALNNAPDDIKALWSGKQNELQETKYAKTKARYNYGKNRVYLNPKATEAGSEYSAPFETHFHEYGHNLDALYGKDGKYLSQLYRRADGKTFDEIITAEWDKKFTSGDKLNNAIRAFRSNLDTENGGTGGFNFVKSSLTEWRRENNISRDDARYKSLLDAIIAANGDNEKLEDIIKNNIDIFDRGQYDELYKLKDAVSTQSALNEYIKDKRANLTLSERANLSDMLERYSITHGGPDFPLGVGHGKSYATQERALSRETFAEMFASEITNDPSLDVIKKELPESYKAFREMIKGVTG